MNMAYLSTEKLLDTNTFEMHMGFFKKKNVEFGQETTIKFERFSFKFYLFQNRSAIRH